MKAIRIHEKDNAAVALCDLKANEECAVGGDTIRLNEAIPAGHKFALTDIRKNEKVIKYGYPIGHASQDIRKGDRIHSHDLKSDIAGKCTYIYAPDFAELPPKAAKSFLGYLREDGRVGIRNEVWIVPTVGCVNSVVRQIEREAQAYKTENIDAIVAFTHPYGCSQLGDDMKNTLKFLAGLIRNPNAGAVLVVGLGCENGNIGELKRYLGDAETERIRFLTAQDCEDEIGEGMALVQELCEYAGRFTRTRCSAADLVVGLKCGGSDGFSGITANPLVGAFSDKLIAMGGSTVLTEVPEMFGAETILMNRCRTKKLFDKTVEMINGFKDYFMKYGEKTDENPSPGNKAGGITTLAEKSLGCIQKGGSAPVSDVLEYAKAVRTRGLSLLKAPGNDLVASNALAASGAQIVLFTTGRGTPFGCPVPTLKISSNSALCAKKKNWIDFDAGSLLETASLDDLSEQLLTLILETASGKKTKSEGSDNSELAIFKDGVTL